MYSRLCLALFLIFFASSALPAETSKKSSDWLFVVSGSDISLNKHTVVIKTQSDIFAFTDRPNRFFRRLDRHEFISLWDNAFFEEAPNAVLSWYEQGIQQITEIELLKARQSAETIEFDVQIITGRSQVVTSEGVLFIDDAEMQWTGSGRPIHDIPQHLYD